MLKRILKLFQEEMQSMNKIKNLIFFLLTFPIFTFAQNLPAQEGKVYVCPLATKMEEINPRCDCRIDLVLGETVTSTCGTTTYEMRLTITEYEGKEYFAILGFESGGAGVNFAPKAKILAPSQALVGEKILFDGSKSFDENEDPLDFFGILETKHLLKVKKFSILSRNLENIQLP